MSIVICSYYDMSHLLCLYELIFDDFQPSWSDMSDVIYIHEHVPHSMITTVIQS